MKQKKVVSSAGAGLSVSHPSHYGSMSRPQPISPPQTPKEKQEARAAKRALRSGGDSQGGGGGMGNHKHGTSGYAPRSPKYKMDRTREANALLEAERAKRPLPIMYASVADALKNGG